MINIAITKPPTARSTQEISIKDLIFLSASSVPVSTLEIKNSPAVFAS